MDRKFSTGDTLELEFPMELKLNRWPAGGVALERGPLLFALGVKEEWRIEPDDKRSTKDFPSWNLYPASPWNYALDIDEKSLDEIEIVERPFKGDPWSLEAAPILLRVPAKKVSGWKLRKLKQIVSDRNNGGKLVKGNFAFTPPLPTQSSLKRRLAKRRETITLEPYGCTHLRITLFPSAR